VLRNLGVVRSSRIPVKVLGNGELTAKLNVSAAKFTESAKGKIEQAGGTAAIDE
jgi:large subunit ribosomal protein L15